MKLVLVVDIDTGGSVFQHEDGARRRLLVATHHSMKTKGGMFNIVVALHVFQQVKPELIQAKVHDADTCIHLFKVDDILLQTF